MLTILLFSMRRDGMPICKSCGSTQCVKNGRVRHKQRYRCKVCGFNFVEGDLRASRDSAMKKQLLCLMRKFGDVPLREVADLLHVWPSQLYRWERADGKEAGVAGGSVRAMRAETVATELARLLPSDGEKTIVMAAGSPWEGGRAIVLLYEDPDRHV